MQLQLAPFFDRVLGPKNGPEDLQANLIVYVVLRQASQTVLVEKLKVFKKARRDAAVRFQQNHQKSGKNAISNSLTARRNGLLLCLRVR